MMTIILADITLQESILFGCAVAGLVFAWIGKKIISSNNTL